MAHELIFDADEVGVNQVVGNIRKAREDLAFIPECAPYKRPLGHLESEYNLPWRVSHIIAHASKAPAVRAQAVAFVDDMLRLGVGYLAICKRPAHRIGALNWARCTVSRRPPQYFVDLPTPPLRSLHLGVKFLFSSPPRKLDERFGLSDHPNLAIGFGCYAGKDLHETYRLVEDPTVPRDHEVMGFAPRDDWDRHYELLRELWTEKKRAPFTYQDRRKA